MRRNCILLGLVFLLVACNAPSSLSPKGREDYYADQAVKAFGEVARAAIVANTTPDAHGQPLLATETTRRVVQFAYAANGAIGQVGWSVSVAAGYDAMKETLTKDEIARLAPYLAAVDAILMAVAPGGGK